MSLLHSQLPFFQIFPTMYLSSQNLVEFKSYAVGFGPLNQHHGLQGKQFREKSDQSFLSKIMLISMVTKAFIGGKRSLNYNYMQTNATKYRLNECQPFMHALRTLFASATFFCLPLLSFHNLSKMSSGGFRQIKSLYGSGT